MKPKEKKAIIKTIRTLWVSLDSHLDATYEKTSASDKKRGETNKFHAETTVEYAIEILRLCKLL